ncbi:hypothetical protein SAMN03097699_2696 [Flavobacteriaceae bacterium MAR_2010_188]|nr:hypothetical protein SAMN03097699_2696 [Flavobacteriaceae bacterium MAR_2010_188]
MDYNSFKLRQFSFLLQNALVTVLLYGIHKFILTYFLQDITMFYPLWHMYLFHFVITTIFYTVLNYRYSSGHRNVFTTFMIATFLKMGLAILFLLPLILSDFSNKQPDIFNFFIGYFFYLFFEVFVLTKLLKK